MPKTDPLGRENVVPAPDEACVLLGDARHVRPRSSCVDGMAPRPRGSLLDSARFLPNCARLPCGAKKVASQVSDSSVSARLLDDAHTEGLKQPQENPMPTQK